MSKAGGEVELVEAIGRIVGAFILGSSAVILPLALVAWFAHKRGVRDEMLGLIVFFAMLALWVVFN